MSLMTATELLMQGARKLRPQDVFATSLYAGNAATQTVTNELDLAGKGGLVWVKGRSGAYNHNLTDAVRGPNVTLRSNATGAEFTGGQTVTAFNANGFALGNYVEVNAGDTYAAWSFRRAKKFFDIVTYTGNGVAGRQIPHGLGDVPGMIIVKRRDVANDWIVYHRSAGSDSVPRPNQLYLNRNEGIQNDGSWGAVTSSYFTVNQGPVNNLNGATYVAYLFAQNPDLIDCGSYVGNGSTSGPLVTCGKGWKPQWLLIKSTGGGTDWIMLDTSRDAVNPVDGALRANSSGAEVTGWPINFLPSGFQPADGRGDINTQGGSYIYVAIRSPT